jgi:hypothetical protein
VIDKIVLVVVFIWTTAWSAWFFRRHRMRRNSGRRTDDTDDTPFSPPGYAVEVDCRGCGQFNRVPSHRLRDRPSCGRCKTRLMPGKHLVLVRSTVMDKALQTELSAVWAEEDQFWKSLADHVALDAKARAEAKDPNSRVVN